MASDPQTAGGWGWWAHQLNWRWLIRSRWLELWLVLLIGGLLALAPSLGARPTPKGVPDPILRKRLARECGVPEAKLTSRVLRRLRSADLRFLRGGSLRGLSDARNLEEINLSLEGREHLPFEQNGKGENRLVTGDLTELTKLPKLKRLDCSRQRNADYYAEHRGGPTLDLFNIGKLRRLEELAIRDCALNQLPIRESGSRLRVFDVRRNRNVVWEDIERFVGDLSTLEDLGVDATALPRNASPALARELKRLRVLRVFRGQESYVAEFLKRLGLEKRVELVVERHQPML